METKLKGLWLDALRSGDYRQTQNTLKDNDGYCCLGVLCHVAAEAGLLPADTEVIETDGKLVLRWPEPTEDNSFCEDDNELPNLAFGLDADLLGECMARNDGSHEYEDNPQSFAQIADFIEAQVTPDDARAALRAARGEQGVG